MLCLLSLRPERMYSNLATNAFAMFINYCNQSVCSAPESEHTMGNNVQKLVTHPYPNGNAEKRTMTQSGHALPNFLLEV